MHVLILAAGVGSRLGQSVPKCLVDIDGRTLLERQVDALRAAGADDLTIVVGHRQEQIRAVAGNDVRFVTNDRYAVTNSLYSFWMARCAVKDRLLVLNSDVLFPARMITALLETGKSCLAFDSGSGTEEEHMKVRVHNGGLVEMSKSLPLRHSHGENVGVLSLSPRAARAAFDAASSLVRRGRERDWLGSAISSIAARHKIHCLDVAGLPWVEIDFPHDLVAARTRVWPEIASMRRLPQGSTSGHSQGSMRGAA